MSYEGASVDDKQLILQQLGFDKPPAGLFDTPPTGLADFVPAAPPAIPPRPPNRKERRRARTSKLATLWLFDRVVRAALAQHAKQPDATPFKSEHQALYAVEAYARQQHDFGNLSKVDKVTVCGLCHARRTVLKAQRDKAAEVTDQQLPLPAVGP